MYLFGPVPSRRLGRSLGIDLIPFKTCPYDCLYCQLGNTTDHTAKRKDWIETEAIIEELKNYPNDPPDYITLSGSGEPTLHSQLDTIIEAARKRFPDTPVAVLTNGALLDSHQLRQQLQRADLVIPSLDAGSASVFQKVNKPCSGIRFDSMVDGLAQFCQTFPNQIWLEVLLLEGIYPVEEEAKKVADIVRHFRIDRIQLNTVVRPPADHRVSAVSEESMKRCLTFFEQPTEIIADYSAVNQQSHFIATTDTVLQMLKRRPCSIDEISSTLGLHRNEVLKYITELLNKNAIESIDVNDRTCYRGAITD